MLTTIKFTGFRGKKDIQTWLLDALKENKEIYEILGLNNEETTVYFFHDDGMHVYDQDKSYTNFIRISLREIGDPHVRTLGRIVAGVMEKHGITGGIKITSTPSFSISVKAKVAADVSSSQ